jgi:hypothetical protein
MVKISPQLKKVIQVETRYGIVEKVPVIDWKEFIPYWPDICRAIFEVLLENDFQPYTATLKRPKGFVAYGGYWKMSNKNPKKVPLSDARYFIYKLQEKPYFTDSIRQFNQKNQKDWLAEKNIAILGGFLYGFYYTLKPVLKIVKKENDMYLKPKIALKRKKI